MLNSKIIQGYGKNRYKIYDDGMVISLGRVGTRGNIVKDKVLSQHFNNKNGYLRVCLNLCGKTKSYYVHRLVAEHFVPNPDNKNIVNHKDGDKTNNNAGNLEWVTSSENNFHAFKVGLKTPTICRGADNWNSRFTQDDIEWIRKNYIKGDKTYGQCALARKFGVSQATIWAIVHNKSWIHTDLAERAKSND